LPQIGTAVFRKKYNALLFVLALSYFAIDSRNKTGQNGFAVKPSQDGEDLIFENIREYLVLSN
jgi:hypothetical protein